VITLNTRRWLYGATVGLVAITMTGHMASAQQASSSQAKQATFNKDVMPILQRACQNCHRPGSIAPMSLLTYKDARPWAKSIQNKVANREMPPWFIDKTIGVQKFKGDPSLSDEEIGTIVSWVAAGAPEGRPADLPPAATFDDLNKWHIGKPDLIVPLPVEWKVPVAAPDQWPDLYTDSGLKEDRYIKSIEFKPGSSAGFRVIHHAHNYLLPPESDNDADPLNSSGEETLNEYAVGKGGDIFPAGTGRLMKAGSRIHFNLHYHAVGEEISDRGELGIVFYPKGEVPTHILHTVNMGNMQTDLDIPANGVTRTDGYYHFDSPVKIASFQPHMHDRGKRECIEAIYPSNQREMLNCATFNFGWALIYNYAEDAAPILPAGSFLHIINWHDNTASNKGNPDPRNWVGSGNRTIDEMSFAWVNYYDLSKDEYDKEVAVRRAARTKGSTQNQ